MKKKIISIFFTICLIFMSAFAAPFSLNASADAYSLPAGVSVSAKTALLMNVETGLTVFESNIDEKVYPASLTKLLTALVVLEKIPDISTVITAYDRVMADIAEEGASNSEIMPGENLTVEQLLYCLLVPSACDAANVLAMHISGSFDGFVALMNEKAQALGMTSSHFANPSGLHDNNQFTTTRDLLILAQETLKSDLLMKICGSSRYEIPETNEHSERTLVTTNYMIDEYTAWYSPSTKGIKTGNTDESGHNLITYSQKDNSSYICIVTGCMDHDDGSRPDFDDTFTLLNWAYDNLVYKKLCGQNEALSEVKVKLCRTADHVSAVTANDFYSMVPYDAVETIIIHPVLNSEEIMAPVKKGTVLGYAVISCAGVDLGKVDLVAGEDLDRNFILYIEYQIGRIVTSTPFFIIVLAVIIIVAVLVLLNVRSNKKRRRYYNSKVKNRHNDR